jgi:hypothetical protein
VPGGSERDSVARIRGTSAQASAKRWRSRA